VRNQNAVLPKTFMTLKRCPVCGFLSTDEAEHFCPNDGEKLTEACPSCNAPLRYPLAEFCYACGKPLFAPPHQRPKES